MFYRFTSAWFYSFAFLGESSHAANPCQVKAQNFAGFALQLRRNPCQVIFQTVRSHVPGRARPCPGRGVEKRLILREIYSR